jgi:hypothetical protein
MPIRSVQIREPQNRSNLFRSSRFTGKLELDSPALFSTIRKHFHKKDLEKIVYIYSLTFAKGCTLELKINRHPEMNFNPRPARIAQIFILEFLPYFAKPLELLPYIVEIFIFSCTENFDFTHIEEVKFPKKKQLVEINQSIQKLLLASKKRNSEPLLFKELSACMREADFYREYALLLSLNLDALRHLHMSLYEPPEIDELLFLTKTLLELDENSNEKFKSLKVFNLIKKAYERAKNYSVVTKTQQEKQIYVSSL